MALEPGEPDPMSGTPLGGSSWIATNLRPITVLGVPAVVMGFLVWWLTTEITGRLTRIEDAVRLHDRQLTTAIYRLDAFLYSMCLSVSTTEVDRARCAIARSEGNVNNPSPPAR